MMPCDFLCDQNKNKSVAPRDEILKEVQTQEGAQSGACQEALPIISTQKRRTQWLEWQQSGDRDEQRKSNRPGQKATQEVSARQQQQEIKDPKESEAVKGVSN